MKEKITCRHSVQASEKSFTSPTRFKKIFHKLFVGLFISYKMAQKRPHSPCAAYMFCVHPF